MHIVRGKAIAGSLLEIDFSTVNTANLRQFEQLSDNKDLIGQKKLPGIANDEAAEHCSNSSSWAGHSDCGSSSTNELGCSVNVPRDGAGLEGACHDCRLADWQKGLKEEKELESIPQLRA